MKTFNYTYLMSLQDASPDASAIDGSPPVFHIPEKEKDVNGTLRYVDSDMESDTSNINVSWTST